MRFGSLCSGIEAASVAFKPLGWTSAWFSEIDPFACALLAHHYPETPNFGDMTTIRRRIESGEIEAPDLLCGGTPCQSFSFAGLRESLNDSRGNLTLEFVRIADAIDSVRRAAGKPPAWVLWENVPGVLSTPDNAFGAFLGGLCGSDSPIPAPPAGWPRAGVVDGPNRAVAWRVLDAQFFGLAQRRQRVFVVALSGPGRWAAPDALLPIVEGMRGHPAPSREAWQDTAGTLEARTSAGGFPGTDGAAAGHVVAAIDASFGRLHGASHQDANHGHSHLVAFGGNNTSGPIDIATAVRAKGGTGHGDFESETFVTHALTGEGFDASEDGTGRGTPMVPVAFDTTQITSTGNRSNPQPGDPCHTLAAGSHPPAIAFQERGREGGRSVEIGGELSYALTAPNGGGRGQERNVMTPAMHVRRLTPRECERLQGFADDYTLIPWRGKPADKCPDGPRYRAIGNSWAVPCVRWIGQQIERARQGQMERAA